MYKIYLKNSSIALDVPEKTALGIKDEILKKTEDVNEISFWINDENGVLLHFFKESDILLITRINN